MNVLVIHPSLNAGGGSERVCLAVIESLKENGYNVMLGTFEQTDWKKVKEFFGNVVKPDIEFVRPRFFGMSAYGELLNFHFLLSNIPKKYEVAFVSCTSPWFYCPVAKKTVIYMIPPVDYRYGLKRAYLVPYTFLQSRFLKKVKNKVILTNSSFSSRIIEEVYSLKPKVVYPPVDVEKFYPSSKKDDLVVSVGRINSYKRYEILIRAFFKVNFGRCVIIGSTYSGASLRYLEKLKRLVKSLRLSDRVRLIVNSSFRTLKHFLSKAKIYVHSASFEHFGISVVEAMACGCVPIVHKSGGPYEDIIEYGKYGFSFTEINELADKIKLLLKDDDLHKEFSKKVLERSKNFGRDIFQRNIRKIL